MAPFWSFTSSYSSFILTMVIILYRFRDNARCSSSILTMAIQGGPIKTVPFVFRCSRMFLERINLRYTTEHDSKLSRYHIQNNCSMCPPFTRTTAFSLSLCHATDQWNNCRWSVGQDSFNRCALSLRSFCRCVSSVTVVLWQKINLNK